MQARAGGRAAGDFSEPKPGEALEKRGNLREVPWTWLHQVHGKEVAVVRAPRDRCGDPADAAVSNCAGAGLAVLTADCAPIALASPEAVVGVVHAGWRGLVAGVVQEAARAMRDMGAKKLFAALGPCVQAHAYPFSEPELLAVSAVLGAQVRSTDDEGRPALDLPGAVRSALDRAGIELLADSGICTHCSDLHWSWRARRDTARQAMVAWLPAAN